jgi:hypothetical protein
MTTITDALRAARACIQQDRTSLADTGMRHDNTMEPEAAAGVAEYDAVLQQIDAALAGMTHHITDEQIAQIAEQVGLVGPASRVGDCHAASLRFARAVLALAAPHGAPTISTKHGPWLPSAYDEGETYCQRCKTRSIFASNRQRDPHIVYTAPAPAVPSDEPAEFERAYNRLFRGRGVDTRHISDCEAVWMARAALTAAPTPPEQSVDLLERCAKWCDEQARSDWWGRRASDMVRAFAATTKAAQPAVPESADSGQAAQEYGDTYLPWGFTVCRELEPQEKRLMSMLIKAFGSGHPAIDDMAHLILTRCGPAQQKPAVPEDVARVNKQMLEALEDVLPDLPSWHVTMVNAAIDAARKAEKGGA